MPTEKKFKEYLALYGADLECWPQEVRDTLRRPAFAALIAEERRFEETLKTRAFELARPGLSGRIIASARPLHQSSLVRIAVRAQEFFSMFILPKPAYALAAMLAIGVFIGLSAPATSVDEQDYSMQLDDDTGAIL